MPREITAFSNPLVKTRPRRCATRSTGATRGQFLAEGLRILTEAREAGRLPRTSVLRRRERRASAGRTRCRGDVEAAGGEVIETTPDILAKLSGKDNPQAVRRASIAEFDTALADARSRRAAPIWLVAERLRDPGNLGTILRTGDAVGAGGLILIDDCVDPFSVEAVRASMGALFTVPVARARVGRVPGLAARRARAAGRAQPAIPTRDYRGAALRSADLPARRQRSAGPAGRL